MKTTAFLIYCAAILISLDVVASDGEKVSPPRSNFPLFMLPSFTLPSFNLQYLQRLASANRQNPSERVVSTKTEHVEVTRRQTVHPICYTAYEAKAPCLPYAQSAFQYDDYDAFEFDSVHEAQESFDLNAVRSSIQATPTVEITPTEIPDRGAKYLEFKIRRNHEEPMETSSRIEGSEFFASALGFPPQLQPTEYLTKTVLITKLEKYTDRRVTATLVALNCLPADRSIPVCQSPIKETPDRRVDVDPGIDSYQVDPQLVSSEKSESEEAKTTEAYPEEPQVANNN